MDEKSTPYSFSTYFLDFSSTIAAAVASEPLVLEISGSRYTFVSSLTLYNTGSGEPSILRSVVTTMTPRPKETEDSRVSITAVSLSGFSRKLIPNWFSMSLFLLVAVSMTFHL